MVQKKILPVVKKKVEDFILDEDAKVLDKTTFKIAVYGTLYLIAFLKVTNPVNAKGHKDSKKHHNDINAKDNFGTNIHAGINPLNVSVNQIPKKTVETMHANHYNHLDESKGNAIMSFFGWGKSKSDAHDISTGAPHHVSEAVLKSLQSEEK